MERYTLISNEALEGWDIIDAKGIETEEGYEPAIMATAYDSDSASALVACKMELDRLADFILAEMPEEIGKGNPQAGESAVDVAIRLMKGRERK